MEKRGSRLKNKRQNSNHLVIGYHPVLEYILANKPIGKILIQKNIKSEHVSIIQKCKEVGIPYQLVPIEKLNKISSKNHQGIIAFISPIEFSNVYNLLPQLYEEGKIPFFLMLDRITDVRNFGAICRTAECAGVHAILIPEKGSARINEDAIKASAGALAHLHICREHNLKKTIQFLKESGLLILACTEKSENTIYQENLDIPLCIILGSEDDGISPEYLKLSDKKAKIPMYGNIRSLNVSVSAAIIIYEILRQRKKLSI